MPRALLPHPSQQPAQAVGIPPSPRRSQVDQQAQVRAPEEINGQLRSSRASVRRLRTTLLYGLSSQCPSWSRGSREAPRQPVLPLPWTRSCLQAFSALAGPEGPPEAPTNPIYPHWLPLRSTQGWLTVERLLSSRTMQDLSGRNLSLAIESWAQKAGSLPILC